MKNNSIRTLTTLGILTAIILVMAFTPLGYIRTLGLSVTLIHIPVIVGAIITGPVGGAILGAVFGLTSFFQCFGMEKFGTTLFSMNPVGTFVLCMIPRILLGVLAALLYRLFSMLSDKTAGIWTGVIATLSHTVMFMGLLSLFFYNTPFIQGFAEMLGVSNVFAFIVAFVGLQGLIEVALAAVVAGAVVPVLKKVRRT